MKCFPMVIAMLAIAVPCAAYDTATKVGTTGTYSYVVDGSDGLLYRSLNGDGASARFDIVIIGDGYQKTHADQRRLTSAAEQFVNGLFAVAPFSEARDYINVYLVNLISNDSGIDDPDPDTETPSPPLVRDTALDCSFIAGSMEITGSFDKAEEACHLAGIPFDVVYIIVNDSLSQDGSWWNPSPPVAISSDLFTWGTVMAHELGHAIATLADEYRAPDCGACLCPEECVSHIDFRTYRDPWVPEEPNVTNASDSLMVPWKDLMTTGAFPTTVESVCNGEAIGRWEGAAEECFGIYRPREYCLMDGVMGDDPLVDDFCPVCSRAIVDSLATNYAYSPPP